jgi:hypothetical protein
MVFHEVMLKNLRIRIQIMTLVDCGPQIIC